MTVRPSLNPWLDDERGHLSDWLTQRWVRATGRVVSLAEEPWLDGPAASPHGVGPDFVERYARGRGMEVARKPDAGLLAAFGELRGPEFDPSLVDPPVVEFYERTTRFDLHLWSEWSPAFRPFGRAVDATFSRRLEQLQLPLAPLDTSRGISSELIHLTGGDGSTETAWVRRRLPGGEVIYAGFYAIARPPRSRGPCVRVVFPLPNGNASVFLEPRVGADRSLELVSPRAPFGGAGFYFVIPRGDGSAWARRIPLTERIHVYADATGLHTDHVFRLWNRVFLRLHYAMTPRAR